jgi:hypothetical protein
MNADAKKRYKDIEFPYTCPISNRTFETPQGLSCYVTKTLKKNHEEYYDEYINHRENSCYFCGNKGKFISISKGYRNLCDSSDCVKKSFNSHSVEGFMYRNMCSKEEAENLFKLENERQLNLRIKTQHKLRKIDPLWDKKRSRNCKEFWIEKGFSEEDAISKTKEVMNEIHSKTSIKLKSNPEKYASKYPTKIEYYLERGLTEEEAKERISEIQNRFSLKICIEKYGEKDGIRIFQNRQEKWHRSLTDNGNIKGGYSEISQKLFREMINFYDIKELSKVFFYTKNSEFILKSGKSILLYDFTDTFRMKIIEYNGDQYHANPNIYVPDSYPHPYHKSVGYTAKDIWDKDKNKIELANKNGYEVLTIWDSEYRKYPDQTLKKCLDFLNIKS